MASLRQGGMGEVYLARDVDLGRRVALKLILPERLKSQGAVDSFLQEARITARFNHPNIVTVYGAGRHEDSPFVALEYVDGEVLKDRIADEPLPAWAAVRLALPIAHALAEAHSHGVLHRDLKPDNVIVGRDGRVRVLDFGLATFVRQGDLRAAAGGGEEDGEEDARQLLLSHTGGEGGGWNGTPAYMSPEQWREEICTEAADVWALGVILHELVTGRRPYTQRSAFALGVRVVGEEPTPIAMDPDDAPELAQLLRRCLAKGAEQRPTAQEVADRLAEMGTPGMADREGEQSPYRGLQPFLERHAAFFFGREAEIAEFVERLREQPVLPVVGPSGAGKSSFVQAGVVPRLREHGRWTVLRLRPGNEPFRALAGRLVSGESTLLSGPSKAQPSAFGTDAADLPGRLAEHPTRLALELEALADRTGSSVLLFVDQLEELFTHAADLSTQRAFLEALCTGADDPSTPVRIIFTVRDDFLGRVAQSAAVRRAVGGVTLVRAPREDALRELLTQPAKLAGYRFERDETVQGMIDSVAGEASGLPLLEFAADALWRRRDTAQRLLLHSAYEAIGGVEGALADHADRLLQGIGADELAVARQILTRLVSSEGTRKVVPRADLVEDLGTRADVLVDRLIEGRLLSSRRQRGEADAGAQVELTHESLVTRWAQLARWLEMTREDRQFLEECSHAAQLWERHGRRREDLWQDRSLADAAERLDGLTTPVPAEVRRFLSTSTQLARRRARRRRVGLLVAFVALALTAIAAGVVALRMSALEFVANEERREAEIKRAVSEREGAKLARARDRTVEAKAKVRAALEVEDSSVARGLWRALRRDPIRWRYEAIWHIAALVYSPDGQWIAIGMQGGHVKLINALTGRARPLRGHRDSTGSLAFSPDSKWLASADRPGELRVWDVVSGGSQVLPAREGRLGRLAFSPDGHALAVGYSDGELVLWDVRTKAALLEHQADGRWPEVAFLDRDRLLVVSGDAGVLLDAKTARPLAPAWQGGDVVHLALHRGSSRVALARADGRIDEVDLRSGDSRTVGRRHLERTIGLAFAGDRLLTAEASEGLFRVYAVAPATSGALYERHKGALRAAFDPAGGAVVTDGDGLVLHDLGGGVVARDVWHGSADRGCVLADGLQGATAGDDGHVVIWALKSGRHRKLPAGHFSPLKAISCHPTDSWIVSGGLDRTINVFDAAGGRSPSRLASVPSAVRELQFSRDGRSVASGHDDGTVRIWAFPGGTLVRQLSAHGGRVRAVEFSRDNRVLATGGADRLIRLWDWRTGVELRALSGHTGGVMDAVFGPDDAWLVSGAGDGTVRRWDLTTGQPSILAREQGQIWSVDLDPAGRRIVWGGSHVRAHVHSLGAPVAPTPPGQESSDVVAFTRDGASVFTADHHVRLLDAETGRQRWRPEGLDEGPTRVSGLVDGVAAPWGDGTVTAVGTALRTISGNGRVVGSWTIPSGATAVARIGDALLVGYGQGWLVRLEATADASPTDFPLEGGPTHAVLRMLQGPAGTLAAGLRTATWASGASARAS